MFIPITNVIITSGSEILDVDNTRQNYNYDCGPSALRTVLDYYGIDVNRRELEEKLGTDKKEGTDYRKIVSVSKDYGLEAKVMSGDIEKLKKAVNNGIPVIVALQAWDDKPHSINEWEKEWEEGHYVVVVGFTKGIVFFADPSHVKRTWLKVEEFVARWHDKECDDNKIKNLMIMIYGKSPGYKAIHMD